MMNKYNIKYKLIGFLFAIIFGFSLHEINIHKNNIKEWTLINIKNIENEKEKDHQIKIWLSQKENLNGQYILKVTIKDKIYDTMYQLNKKWSFGAGFEYVEHRNNGVKSIHTSIENKSLPIPVEPYSVTTQDIINGLLAETNNMKDGWDEYILKISAAYQMTDSVQLAPFFEYTFDDAQPMSQNATDFKMELGVRLNAQF